MDDLQQQFVRIEKTLSDRVPHFLSHVLFQRKYNLFGRQVPVSHNSFFYLREEKKIVEHIFKNSSIAGTGIC